VRSHPPTAGRNEAKPGLNMPPQRRASPTPKPKERPASKGRVHMGKSRN
jgi:hypothetical protein